MISTLGQGFALGLAYAAPIGAQNLFVIDSASRGNMRNALRTALIFATMDISLGIACIVGIGQLIQSHDLARLAIGAVGSAFLFFIGYKLISKRAEAAGSSAASFAGSLWKAAFLLTWCNPHALIDGSVLLGGYQSSMSSTGIYVFALGLALASTTWFLSLSTIVNYFKSVVTSKVMTIINRICGAVMVVFGARLALSVLGV